MKKILKKQISFLLAAILCLTAVNIVFADGNDSKADSIPLILNNKEWIAFEEGETYFFTFTPEKTGSYTFYSDCNLYISATLYNDNNQELSRDRSNSYSRDFFLTYDLSAGECYTYTAWIDDDEGGKCLVCLTDSYTSGHDFYYEDVDATCTGGPGIRKTCVNCGISVFTQKGLPLGHNVENGICTRCGEEITDNVKFVVLGDSIAEGYGISKNSCYGKIVADSNNYEYSNFARSGMTSGSLLKEIQEPYTVYDSWSFLEDITTADIINISIGGNDYFLPFFFSPFNVFFDTLFHRNTELYDTYAERLFVNLCGIYDGLKELNPDAVIIFNNMYRSWGGIGRLTMNQAVSRINAQINRLQELHNDILILDTSSVITSKPEMISGDTIHPSAKGHEAIAKKLLTLLYDHNLGTAQEPVNYVPGTDPEKGYIERNYGRTVYILALLLTGNVAKLFK